MTDQLAGRLAEHGILGLLLVAACVVVYRLYGQLDATQRARLDDAKAYQAQLVDLIRTVTAALTSANAAAEATKEALGEVRETFDKLADEVRRAVPPRRP